MAKQSQPVLPQLLPIERHILRNGALAQIIWHTLDSEFANLVETIRLQRLGEDIAASASRWSAVNSSLMGINKFCLHYVLMENVRCLDRARKVSKNEDHINDEPKEDAIVVNLTAWERVLGVQSVLTGRIMRTAIKQLQRDPNEVLLNIVDWALRVQYETSSFHAIPSCMSLDEVPVLGPGCAKDKGLEDIGGGGIHANSM
ncbi:MAG: hypothetical protein Q9162_005880 [Coniocarpon cinnabarinum]